VDFGGDLVVQVVTGSDHTCALTSAGGVRCFGRGAYGRLGYGDTYDRSTPGTLDVDLGGGAVAVQLAAGDKHTCALTAVGGVRCWGYGSNGQLGDGAQSGRDTPSADLDFGGDVMAQVYAGSDFGCALTSAGALRCWGLMLGGLNGLGLGYSGDTSGRSSPGGDVITGLVVYEGAPPPHPSPALLPSPPPPPPSPPPVLENVVAYSIEAGSQVSLGYQHTCAVTAAAAVRCWGDGYVERSGQTHTHTSFAAFFACFSRGAFAVAACV
jgi:alpha-tubulin suppressor-like RCC1 family protein